MKSSDKMLKTLGLAMRKGDIIIGAKRTIEALKTTQNLIVFMSQDTASNTAKKIQDKTKSTNTTLNTDFSTEALSQAIGKRDVKVLAMRQDAIKL